MTCLRFGSVLAVYKTTTVKLTVYHWEVLGENIAVDEPCLGKQFNNVPSNISIHVFIVIIVVIIVVINVVFTMMNIVIRSIFMKPFVKFDFPDCFLKCCLRRAI